MSALLRFRMSDAPSPIYLNDISKIAELLYDHYLTITSIGVYLLLFKTTAMIDLENYVNIHEAAKQLGIHEESLRRLLRIGSLPGEKIGGQWFIGREQLALFVATYDAKTGKRRHLF